MAATCQAAHRMPGDPGLVKEVVDLLSRADRPLIVTGSGILWSNASEELQQFVDATGIPFMTTPQGRGVIPDDHPQSFLLPAIWPSRIAMSCSSWARGSIM